MKEGKIDQYTIAEDLSPITDLEKCETKNIIINPSAIMPKISEDPIFSDDVGEKLVAVLVIEEDEPFFSRLTKEIFEKQKNRPDVFWGEAQNKIIYLAAQDPAPAHYKASREVLEDKKITPTSNSLIDDFARELVTQCQRLEKKIRKTKMMFIENEEGGYNEVGFHYSLFISQDPCKGAELITYENKEMFWLDFVLLEFISKIGSHGKKAAKTLTQAFKQRYKEFTADGKKDMPSIFKLWVSKSNPFYPPYLKLLAEVVWEDIIYPKEQKKEKLKAPAISRKLWVSSMAKLFLKENNVTETEKRLEYRDTKGELLAHADVAAIDSTTLQTIKSGIANMPGVNGIKAFTWIVRRGYHNVIEGCKDPRLIQTTGGYSGIAEMMGCTSKNDQKQIKEILHTMDAFRLSAPIGLNMIQDGRLIILETTSRSRFGHPSGINIILGTMLLPHFVFELPKRERLLVPIPELPPTTGDRKTHASQYLLQIHLLEVMSENSRELHKNGYIHIPKEIWTELANKSGLPIRALPKVIDRWTREDGILEADGEYFTLNRKEQGAELAFLKEQGRRREANSRRAKSNGNKSNLNKKKQSP